MQIFFQRLQALSGFGAGEDHREARLFIDAAQLLRGVKIAFVDDDQALHVLVAGDGRHPVDEERLRNGIDIGGKDGQRVHIGHGRPDKAVFSREHRFHHALAMLQGDLHHIAGEGGDMLFAQDTPAPAGNHPIRQLHVIESAQGTDDSSGLFLSHCS